ncbi:hypothetical protein [Arthrobacter sp. UCD-GKA]|uniref:hypothetical protein n=1 Tax=Arthrobacter sp. UCD-GKA TaxID=1913576 RepID=UPI001113A2D2|nr:hypothetical protein [Arthrobacter sp. UCD-GKA]
MMQGQTLADLIEADRYRGSKSLSYESLSRNCGGKPSAQRLQQYVTTDLKNFPDPDTIRGIQRGTGHSAQTMIHAAARSLGLAVADTDPDSLVVAGVATLSPTSIESLKTIARELVTLTSEVHHEDQDKPEANPPGKPTLRTIGTSGKAGQGQKIHWRWAVPNADSIFRENQDFVAANLGVVTGASLLEHVGDERIELLASNIPEGIDCVRRALTKALQFRIQEHFDAIAELPAEQDIAAHFDFKTQRQQFEEAHGERGEENQDLP